eukprot:1734863-Pleurochrysis_carterae.AAC.7
MPDSVATIAAVMATTEEKNMPQEEEPQEQEEAEGSEINDDNGGPDAKSEADGPDDGKHDGDDDKDDRDASGKDGERGRKRMGKSTRWNIPKVALHALEDVFARDKFPSVETRKNLAAELKVTPRQVQVWFQNKRQRSIKPPGKAEEVEKMSVPQRQQHILNNSEDIKAALIHFGHNPAASIEATRAQREVRVLSLP